MTRETSGTVGAIDLKPFCGRNPLLPELLAPFSIDAFTYATDGSILVRVPRRPDVVDLAGTRLSRGKVFGELADAERLSFDTPVPTLPPDIDTGDCSACGGDGLARHCRSCGCLCSVCGGDGGRGGEASVAIGRFAFRMRSVRRVCALPDVVLSVQGLRLFFAFEGGVGVLCALNARLVRHFRSSGEPA